MTKKISNFHDWNTEKISIHFINEHKKTLNIQPRPAEIWLIKLGYNIGSEQDGKENFLRPVLVLASIGSMTIAIPLSTKSKKLSFNYEFSFKGKNSKALLNQIRSTDKKRFIKKMGNIEKTDFQNIKKLLKDFLHL